MSFHADQSVGIYCGTSRRELLRIGGLGLLGLAGLDRAPRRTTAAEAAPAGAPRRCVFLFLFGGPSHIDLWDMKPLAPVEVRVTVPHCHD